MGYNKKNYLFKERKQSYKNQTSRTKMNGKIMNFQQQRQKYMYVQRSLKIIRNLSCKQEKSFWNKLKRF